MPDTTNILIVGVGGQGTVLASKLLGTALLKADFDVKISEVHGMAQRGGSVVTQVRFGNKVFSPIISPGAVDYLLAFEPLEALRCSHYLSETGRIITDSNQVPPVAVSMGLEPYPDVDALMPSGAIVINAMERAKQLGNPKVANVILLGVLSQLLSIEADLWEASMTANLPKKFYDINRQAFRLGRNIG